MGGFLFAAVAAFGAGPLPVTVITAVAPDDAAYELDRPGEVENPFALPPAQVQIVNYLLVASPAGRENEDLGSGGSAVLLQTNLRVSLAPHWEAQVVTDAYLQAIDKGDDGDDPGISRAGLGLVTLRVKWSILSEKDGDFGLALVPFLRFPIRRTLAGRTGAEPGLIVPVAADLGGGWEVQGSTGIAWGRADDGGWDTDWETQVSLEWQFAPRWTVYVEPELEIGDGPAAWSMEQGVTFALSRRLQLDLGLNLGLGRSASARFGYLGMAWRF